MNKPFEIPEDKLNEWMTILLSRAKKAGSNGEVPVAAVILDEFGHCIGHGSNRKEKESDPLAHAEIIALKQASLIKNDWRFNECTLIVNLEPCTMCAGVLVQARMGQVIFGASDYKKGGLGGALDLSKHKSSHHYMLVKKGVMEDISRSMIIRWFKEKRKFTS